MRASPHVPGAWDSEGLAPQGILRALPIGVLLFAMILALPVPANGAGHHATLSPSVSAPPRTGLAWVHLRGPNASLPSGRESASLSTGPGGSGVLMFGGCGPTQCPMGDTWWYRNGVWENLTDTLSSAPAARSGAVMAQDPSSGGVLLFGGCGSNGTALGDSWLFTNSAWNEINMSGNAPPAACHATGTTDPHADGVAVFGGTGSNGSATSSLWLFSKGAWQPLTTDDTGIPAARSDASLSYDPSSGALVLFGGIAANGSTLSDTDEFLASVWITHLVGAGVPSPPARTAAVFGEDPALGADLLFGGQNGSAILADTWTFSNGGWTNLTGSVAHPPIGRTGASGAYDASDGYEIMVGGRTTTTGDRNDTWAFVLPLTAALQLPPGGATPGAVVHFAVSVNGGLPPYRYNWSMGIGGHDIRLPSPYFAYPAPGDYPINLSIVDARGVTTYANGSLHIGEPPIAVALHFSPSAPVPGTVVTLTAVASGGTQPYTASWSGLPSGCSSNGSLTIDCTVRTIGQYTVSVRVTDVHGGSASATALVAVDAAFAAESGLIGGASAAAFQHWGWVLVPPLAGAVAMAAYAAYVTYRINGYDPNAPLPARPDCYVPPEWSETPGEFSKGSDGAGPLPGDGRP
jgi:hypothetical protein